MTADGRPAIVLGAGEGIDASRRNGRDISLKATASHSAGQIAVHEAAHPPGVPGPPVHRHPNSEEAFYVLEGHLRVQVDGTDHTVAPGGFVLVPAGMSHGFVTEGDEPARFLVVHSPAGFEQFFVAVAEAEAANGGELGPGDLGPIASRFDWEAVGPPMPVRTPPG